MNSVPIDHPILSTSPLYITEQQLLAFFPENYRWSYNALLALAAGGQVGDIDLILDGLRSNVGDDRTWHEQWTALAKVLEERAQECRRLGGRASVSEHLFLASLYHLVGEHFLPPRDPQRRESYDRALRRFEEARQLLDWRVERVSVSFDRTSLPAYFLPATRGEGPRPVVIFICGLDTTKELSFLRVRNGLAMRGIHCLAIDTPGTGEALRRSNLPARVDYEKPVGAAIDYLVGRPDVDGQRIGIIGSSLGAYYVTRAAAYDQRISAAVAWGVIYDYQAVWRRRIGGEGSVAAPDFQLMFVTGTETMEDALDRIRDFRVEEIGPLVRCPFLIVHGAEDRQVFPEDVQAMFAAIGSVDKQLKVFSGPDGGAAHCQFDNHLPALHYVADWLRQKLPPREPDRQPSKVGGAP